MTPEQALQLLDNVVSQVRLGRAETLKLLEAVKVLAAAIESTAPDTPPAGPG